MKMSVTYTQFEMHKIGDIVNQVCTMSGLPTMPKSMIQDIVLQGNMTSDAISVTTVKDDFDHITTTIEINENLVGDIIDLYDDSLTGVAAIGLMLKSLFKSFENKMEAINLKWAEKLKPKTMNGKSYEDMITEIMYTGKKKGEENTEENASVDKTEE